MKYRVNIYINIYIYVLKWKKGGPFDQNTGLF